LRGLQRDGVELALANGPRVIGEDPPVLERFEISENDESPSLHFHYSEGALQNLAWTLLPGGWLRLDYTYRMPRFAHRENLGVTFDLNDAEVAAMRWLGRGPVRVWKNRLAGAEFGVWEKTANSGATGWNWDYPEFPGYHANVYWATIQTDSLPFTILFATDDLYLRMLTTEYGPEPGHARVEFPEGDLSFLQGIPAIGTKFIPAEQHGPQGHPNAVGKEHEWTATAYFYFGELNP